MAPGVLAGMGFGSGGEWRRGPSQVYTWAFQVRRKTFFLSVLKATLGSGKGGFGSRVDSHCYGVWEWRRVAPGATLGSGKGGFGSRVDLRCYGVWEWRRVAPEVFAGMGFGVAESGAGRLGKCIGGLFKFGVKLSFYRF